MAYGIVVLSGRRKMTQIKKAEETASTVIENHAQKLLRKYINRFYYN